MKRQQHFLSDLLCFMANTDVREHHIPNKHNIDATQEKVKTNKPLSEMVM